MNVINAYFENNTIFALQKIIKEGLDMRNVFIFLLVILLGFSTNCNADAKKYWKQKLERYEQAKKEAVQEGRTFDPNEYERKERQRIEENAMSPITVLLILGGVVVVIGGVLVFVSNIGEEIKNSHQKVSIGW